MLSHVHTPEQLYSTWYEDSQLKRGFRRICDVKWISLAWYVCQTSYDPFDGQHEHVTMDVWKPHIFPGWFHPLMPIVRMTQRQVVDSLWGLEWLIFSDMFDASPDRGNQAWIDQIRYYVNILRHRAYYLACHALSTEILNVSDLVMTETEYLALAGDSRKNQTGPLKVLTTKDYYSDDDEEDDAEMRMEEKRRPHIVQSMRVKQVMEERKKQLSRERDLEEIARQLIGEDGMGREDRTTWTNFAFAFVMNTILHSIDMGLTIYEKELSRIPTGPLAQRGQTAQFRETLMSRFQNMSTLLDTRKSWYCHLVCTDSHRLLRQRERDTIVQEIGAEEIISVKLGIWINSLLPQNLADFLRQPIGLDPIQWKHVNTDALFYIYSMQLEDGDIYRYLYRTQEQALALFSSGETFIFRIRVTNRWCLVESGTRSTYSTFLHAFIQLRVRMRQRGIPAKVRRFSENGKAYTEVDLGQMDALLFPPT